jgi:D-alanyl-D-alanine carboxypeptidase/D-alanyl-D-alanine-endopeptidase (penicillin-binding protein 4)
MSLHPSSTSSARRRVLVLAAAFALLLAAMPAAAEETPLQKALSKSLSVRALKGAHVAVLVESADGRELFARDPDVALTPASNAKIFTSVAVLSAFGPTHRFETLLSADAPPDADGAIGTLFLRGGGDPAVNSEDWWKIADELARLGLRRIRGDLVLDDSLFDDVRWHPSWGKTSSRAYHAPVGALNANYGAFGTEVRPAAEAGKPARVVVSPPVAHLEVVNRALTKKPGARTALRVDRESAGDHERVLVTGETSADEEPIGFYRSVLDPTRYAGSVLAQQLEARGIVLEGKVRLGAAPETGEELLRYKGRPLSEIVGLCMKYSNNQIAEALVKQLALHAGAERGNWPDGSAEMRRRLTTLGVAEGGYALVDGSGLSYHDRATPRALVQAIRAGEESFAFGPEWIASMAIADRDGTLKKRAEGAAGKVRAKTGTLNRVTALSGLANLQGGERVRFSILVNGYRSGDREAMDAVDGFVTALVTAPATADDAVAVSD